MLHLVCRTPGASPALMIESLAGQKSAVSPERYPALVSSTHCGEAPAGRTSSRHRPTAHHAVGCGDQEVNDASRVERVELSTHNTASLVHLRIGGVELSCSPSRWRSASSASRESPRVTVGCQRRGGRVLVPRVPAIEGAAWVGFIRYDTTLSWPQRRVEPGRRRPPRSVASGVHRPVVAKSSPTATMAAGRGLDGR